MRKTRQAAQQQCSDQHHVLRFEMTPASSEKGMEKVICLMGGPTSPNAPNSIIGVKNEDNNEAGTRAPKLSAGHLLCGPNNEPPPPPPMTIPPLFHPVRLTPHSTLQTPGARGAGLGYGATLPLIRNGKQTVRSC